MLTQDVTLESELWTFDEVEWHETAKDTTTIKYVPVVGKTSGCQNCVNESLKFATEEPAPQQVREWKLFLSLDKMLFHTSDAKRTNNTSLTKAIRTRIAQIEAGNALEILRPIPTNVRSPEDHETKNRPHGRHGQNTTKG